MPRESSRRRTRSASGRSSSRTRTDASGRRRSTALRDAEARQRTTTRGRDFALEQKLEAAAAAPLEIASLGADAAELAALAGEHGDAHVSRGRRGGRRARCRRRVRSRPPRPREPRSPQCGSAPRARARERGGRARRRRRGCASRTGEPTSRALTDAELVRACRAGDADAWNELVERYSRYVYAIAVRGFRLSDEDAEDVFQDVFTRIYTRLDSLRDDSALRPGSRSSRAGAASMRSQRGARFPPRRSPRKGRPT